jgi:SAM-dependent methyltransferase
MRYRQVDGRGRIRSAGAHELEEVVSLLCDPVTREPLQPREEAGRSWLVSSPSGRRFPVRDGIPVLLADADLAARPRRWYGHVAPLHDLSTRLAAGFERARDTARRRECLQGLEIGEGSRVLEVSAGSAANLPLLPATASYFGLDSSWQSLQRSRRRSARVGLNLHLFQGAAERLPFRDAAFDSVFHVGGIHRFSDGARAVAEMVRVAKPATRILIVDERIRLHVGLLPPGMREVETRILAGWELCSVSFRTPPGHATGEPVE